MPECPKNTAVGCMCSTTEMRAAQENTCLLCREGRNLRRVKPVHGLYCTPCAMMGQRIVQKRFTAPELDHFFHGAHNASWDTWRVTPKPWGKPVPPVPPDAK